MPEEVTWTIGDGSEGINTAKSLPYVSTWKSFSKLPEDEKEKLFNAIRGACIGAGLMDNK